VRGINGQVRGYLYYDNASGIRPGTPVLLAGREIGKVTQLYSPVRLEMRPKNHPASDFLTHGADFLKKEN